MSFQQSANRKAIELGKLAVEMTTSAGSGHPSTALSLAHLITVLMYHQMRYDPKDPWNPASDRLVLSEGHAVPIVYAAMADLGVALGKTRADSRPMTRDDAMQLRAIGSPVDGHPNPGLGVHFFDAATGSLGQGLSVAAGLAAAGHADKLDRNIFCIIGDGESREGQIWEAMDFIVDHSLTHAVPIFNCNELAQSDWVSPQQSYQTLARKAEAFGFIVRIIDGHDPVEIAKAFNELHVVQNGPRPLAIVARTVKGWGALAEQGMGKHGTAVKKDKLASVLGELDATARDLGVADYKSNGELKIPAITVSPAAKAAEAATASGSADAKPIRAGAFAEAFAVVGLDMDLSAGKPIAPRKAYGAALVALGKADRRVVALDADVQNSTNVEWFSKRFPEQFFECKIAEQNMFSVAAGLSAAGKIPFASTFAKFVVRAYDQIEMAINSGANIKITGTHAGVTLAADGPSQMSLPDVAFFRSFGHTKNYAGRTAVQSFFPSDAVSCYRITEVAANLPGCCYSRVLRADLPLLYKHEETFEPGGYKVLREGTDGLFVSAGYMVHECLKAADELAKSGRKWGVIDAYGIPFKDGGIVEIATRSGGRIISVEDNYAGGLEAELAVAIASTGAKVKLDPLYVRNIPKSGREPDDVLEYVHLGARDILAAV